MTWGDGPDSWSGPHYKLFVPASWAPLEQLPGANIRVFAFAMPFSELGRQAKHVAPLKVNIS